MPQWVVINWYDLHELSHELSDEYYLSTIDLVACSYEPVLGCLQRLVFPGGHPSKYWRDSTITYPLLIWSALNLYENVYSTYSQVITHQSADEVQLLLIHYWFGQLKACIRMSTAPCIPRWSLIHVLMMFNDYLSTTDLVVYNPVPCIPRWSHTQILTSLPLPISTHLMPNELNSLL